MTWLNFGLDASQLKEILLDGPELKKELESAARDLAAAGYAHAVEQASSKLKVRLPRFLSALQLVQAGSDTWVVRLDASAMWIEEGMPAHSMVEQLLNSPKAKRTKDGKKYITVPFDMSPGKGQSQLTEAQSSLMRTVKSELRRANVPFAKIETGTDKRPLLGKLHTVKSAHVDEKGRGLGSLQVYQTLSRTSKSDKVKRSILSFKTVTEDSEGWEHPGLPGAKVMDELETWIGEQWERRVGPELLARLS